MRPRVDNRFRHRGDVEHPCPDEDWDMTFFMILLVAAAAAVIVAMAVAPMVADA